MAEPPSGTGVSPAQIAKGALRRLAMGKIEPTPENFARAYAEESGRPAPGVTDRARALLDRVVARATDDPALKEELTEGLVQGLTDGPCTQAERALEKLSARPTPWAALCSRLAKGLERSSPRWTAARKKESLQRVLDGSRMDAGKLQQRLQGLFQAWEGDREEVGSVVDEDGDAASPSLEASESASAPGSASAGEGERAAGGGWPEAGAALEETVRAALPATDTRAGELADALAVLATRLERDGADAGTVQELGQLCQRARRWLAHRHHVFDALGQLCAQLGESLVDLAEDESWARGQCEILQGQLSGGVSSLGVRSASTLLAEARQRQRQVRAERDAARDSLKAFIQTLLHELGELGEHTDRFEANVSRHALAIERANSLEGLAGVVKELIADSQSVRSLVRQTQDRIDDEHRKAGELAAKVRELEGELRRLSDEVSTDMLTQVANRRGLAQAFETECARLARDEGTPLAIGLLDIDNFKRLNDSLGHAAGDIALKTLAAAVRDRLRPVDTVARLGGEEFVVLLPGTPGDEAQQALTRLQRALSASLFMHEDREVFVTFSAGVTQWRRPETLEAALERADEALYEAKRTGKNRTCIG